MLFQRPFQKDNCGCFSTGQLRCSDKYSWPSGFPRSGCILGRHGGRRTEVGQPLSSIPSHFKMNQRHRIEAGIFMILYTLYISVFWLSTGTLGSFSSVTSRSLHQRSRTGTRRNPRGASAKSSAPGSFRSAASRSRSRPSGPPGLTRSILAPGSRGDRAPRLRRARPGPGRTGLPLPGALTAQPRLHHTPLSRPRRPRRVRV